MNKSLYRKLSRMARDGDQEAIEAVAEILENLTEPDTEAVLPVEAVAPVMTAPDPAQVVVGYPAAGGVPAVAAPVAVPAVPAMTPASAADPTAVVTVPEGHEVTIDSDLGAAILEKLDQLIALLTPAATDEEVTIVGKHEKQSGELPAEENVGESLEDPIEEIVEAVTEAVEAGAAAEGAVEEPAGEVIADPVAAEVAEVLETLVGPSSVLEPEEEESNG